MNSFCKERKNSYYAGENISEGKWSVNRIDIWYGWVDIYVIIIAGKKNIFHTDDVRFIGSWNLSPEFFTIVDI